MFLERQSSSRFSFVITGINYILKYIKIENTSILDHTLQEEHTKKSVWSMCVFTFKGSTCGREPGNKWPISQMTIWPLTLSVDTNTLNPHVQADRKPPSPYNILSCFLFPLVILTKNLSIVGSASDAMSRDFFGVVWSLLWDIHKHVNKVLDHTYSDPEKNLDEY